MIKKYLSSIIVLVFLLFPVAAVELVFSLTPELTFPFLTGGNEKYDFMGYTFNKTIELSFHHLIIPKKNSKKEGIGDGYVWWNGAILKRDTAHDYLHRIEQIDRETFLWITDIIPSSKYAFFFL